MSPRGWLQVSAMLLGGCVAAAAAGGPAEETHALIEGVHAALMDGNVAAFGAFFDPAMPGFKRLSADAGLLLKESLAPSEIAFAGDTGDGQRRDLELDWRMEIRAYSGAWTVTRAARVKVGAALQDGRWRIVSFAPLDFFAPARGGEVWEELSAALGSLAEVGGGPQDSRGSVPANFLAAFDPRMPGFDRLRTNVIALEQSGFLESSVELASSQGDDRRRTLELDWILSVESHDTGSNARRRHERVKIQVERQGGKWRIVAFEPMDFLAPERPR